MLHVPWGKRPKPQLRSLRPSRSQLLSRVSFNSPGPVRLVLCRLPGQGNHRQQNLVGKCAKGFVHKRWAVCIPWICKGGAIGDDAALCSLANGHGIKQRFVNFVSGDSDLVWLPPHPSKHKWTIQNSACASSLNLNLLLNQLLEYFVKFIVRLILFWEFVQMHLFGSYKTIFLLRTLAVSPVGYYISFATCCWFRILIFFRRRWGGYRI